MRQQFGNRNLCFTRDAKFWPLLTDLMFVVELTCVDEPCQCEGDQALAGGINVHERVFFPKPCSGSVLPSPPKVDHVDALEIDA